MKETGSTTTDYWPGLHINLQQIRASRRELSTNITPVCPLMLATSVRHRKTPPLSPQTGSASSVTIWCSRYWARSGPQPQDSTDCQPGF